ncbi:unnamed protein product [Lepeophtheirus salmonis]|uniref:(salmon louse) hypothetical protein n=1 Tax=Lepeophtheirus salmonis TaxID=72036 RepID=A0A7R8D376_LEPSM|nr:unnamed protein product [Lepeophtheirus salmonis]CAF3013944.1 unnamed protein product [Lepeophtheirus salmonis]
MHPEFQHVRWPTDDDQIAILARTNAYSRNKPAMDWEYHRFLPSRQLPAILADYAPFYSELDDIYEEPYQAPPLPPRSASAEKPHLPPYPSTSASKH